MFTARPSYLTFNLNLEQSDMTHTAGAAPCIRQFHPQLGSGQREPFTHTEEPTLAITEPDAGRTSSIALRRVNTQKLGKAKPRELAQQSFRSETPEAGLEPGSSPRAMLKTIRRPRRLDVRLGQ